MKWTLIFEQDKEQFLRLLNDTEAWLYEEGDDETKTVYNKKLEELKNMVTQYLRE